MDLRYLSGSALQSHDGYRWGSSSATSVTFAVGETSKTVSYRIDADAVPEADETIVLEAYGVSGAAVFAGNAQVLRSESWILDDDGGSNKRALFVSDPEVIEGDGGTRRRGVRDQPVPPGDQRVHHRLPHRGRHGARRGGLYRDERQADLLRGPVDRLRPGSGDWRPRRRRGGELPSGHRRACGGVRGHHGHRGDPGRRRRAPEPACPPCR